MEEKQISLETLFLAKEKGFEPYDCEVETTQCTLQNWLREEHLIYVYPFRLIQFDNNDAPFYFDNNEWSYRIDDLLITKEGIAQMRGYTLQNKLFGSYEQAFEAGLIECLNLI